MTLNSKYNILIVDDEPLIRKSLFEILKMQGFRCQMASSAKEAIEAIGKQPINIVITDMKLPEMSGIALLKKIKQDKPSTEVIVITGYGSIETAVEAMKLKAFDYITKPIVDDEIKIILQKIVEKSELMQENTNLRKIVAKNTRDTFAGIVGANTDMTAIYNLIESVAPTNATILITGESGTGKGAVARAIHQADTARRTMPFVEVSCGALSETLLESELFGHAKGSFTGAIKDKKGRFEVANGGTIFLDEIDTCTPSLQIKLLRILQDGTFERVGETTPQKTDARVIAATNQDLSKLVDAGQFREDLYYRIHVIPITLPPLRNRKDDIPLLVKHFIARFNQKNKKQVTGISNEVSDLFMNYSWPGNVRQLENVIEGAMILAKDTIITKENLPKSFNDREKLDGNNPARSGKSLKDGLKDPEKEIILAALKAANNNRSKTAADLGINRTTLYNKLKKYGIDS